MANKEKNKNGSIALFSLVWAAVLFMSSYNLAADADKLPVGSALLNWLDVISSVSAIGAILLSVVFVVSVIKVIEA